MGALYCNLHQILAILNKDFKFYIIYTNHKEIAHLAVASLHHLMRIVKN